MRTGHPHVLSRDFATISQSSSELRTPSSAKDSRDIAKLAPDSIKTLTANSQGSYINDHYEVDAFHLQAKLLEHTANLTNKDYFKYVDKSEHIYTMDRRSRLLNRSNRFLNLAASCENGLPGNTDAQFELAHKHEQKARASGTASARSHHLEKAADWYVKAARQQHPEAIFRLAEYIEHGLGGYSPNNSGAYKTYLKAQQLGHEEAHGHIARLQDILLQQAQLRVTEAEAPVRTKFYLHANATFGE